MAAGFWLSGATDTIWFLIVTIAAATLTAFALALVRPAPDVRPLPAVRAVVLVTAGLVQLGGLILIRLAIVRDPQGPFGSGLDGEALAEGWSAWLGPMVLFALALTVMVIWRTIRGWQGLGSLRARLQTWSDPAIAGMAFRPAVVAVAVVVIVAMFALPGLGPSEGQAHLLFAGLATPEYGKILLLVVLAVVIARHSHNYFDHPLATEGARMHLARSLPPGSHWLRRTAALLKRFRFAAYPIGLFLIVVVTAMLRNDLGTIIPVLAAVITMTWIAAWQAVNGGRARNDRWRNRLKPDSVRAAVSAYRVFLIAGAIMVLLGGFAMLATGGYVSERVSVWSHPWSYRWDSGCVTVANPPAQVPGVSFCQESMAANLEGARSQVSKALAAVADGGLWGRGLSDTASGVVPVGSTDFVLAVVWNKLGGLIVLAITALIAMLGVALRRTAGRPTASFRSSPATLLAAGLAAMVVGQFLFVFAATLNFIPHSGVPAPFLSRGGQSTLALLLAITFVLALTSRRSNGVTTFPPEETPYRKSRPLAAVPTITATMAMAVAVTIVPYSGSFAAYATDRPPCGLHQNSRESLLSPPPDPHACSTDRILYDRTQIEVLLRGRPVLRQIRPSGGWNIESGSLPSGLELSDLTGLLRVPGGGTGVVDQSFPDVFDGSVDAGILRRLGPPTSPDSVPADGSVDLTIDPLLQHILAAALEHSGDDSGPPLAGGAVLLDAANAEILAAASAPALRPSAGATADVEAAEAFVQSHPAYGRLGPAQTLDGATAADTCRRATATAEQQRDCWRWGYVATPPSTRDRRLLQYVGGDTSITALPDPQRNRALGAWYGLGSTFKVVIAAAYLDQPGHTPDDRIPAPPLVDLAPGIRPIHNAGGGSCTGTGADGRITLRQALTVSCNTAFVRLAQRLGWPAIAEQAHRFGMRVGDCPAVPDQWPAALLSGSAPTCVPSDVDSIAIGNAALGGGPVQGTPLAMASVMATIADSGVAIQPTLVRSVRVPASGATLRPPQDKHTAIPADVAAELKDALSDVATTGTARLLGPAVGIPIWVKTGTHEYVKEGDRLPRGRFVRYYSWLAGFVRTERGTFSFAVVMEAHDEAAGARRNRYVVQQLVQALKEVP